MKVEWRSARTMSGVLCVMTPGEVLMPLWCVDSSDTLPKVSKVLLLNFNNFHDYYIVPTDVDGFNNAHFGGGVGPIHINNVDCRGDEDNLLECSHSSALSCYRGHSEDAGVRCQGILYF